MQPPTVLSCCLCQALAARGATLYMLCRNEQRGQEAAQKVKEASGNSNVHLAVSTTCRRCVCCRCSSPSSPCISNAFCWQWADQPPKSRLQQQPGCY